MSGNSFTTEQRAEIKEIVSEALVEFFAAKGLLGKNILLTAATIIGAVTIIFGGFKVLLGWLGFVWLADR